MPQSRRSLGRRNELHSSLSRKLSVSIRARRSDARAPTASAKARRPTKRWIYAVHKERKGRACGRPIPKTPEGSLFHAPTAFTASSNGSPGPPRTEIVWDLRLMDRLNGLCHPVFGAESWTLSQSFYLESVNRMLPHHVIYKNNRGWIGPNVRLPLVARSCSAAMSARRTDARLGFQLAQAASESVTSARDRNRIRKRPQGGRQYSVDALIYEAEDRLFLREDTLPQGTGCDPDHVAALTLKELVDNGLDERAHVTIRREADWLIVSDDDPGVNLNRVADLFAVNLCSRRSGTTAAIPDRR
jgi:hypothetical protein